MAARQNSSNSGEDNFDFDNEFQFNPSDWMVLDDDNENGNPIDDSLLLEEGSGSNSQYNDITSGGTKTTVVKQQSSDSSSERSIRSKTSNAPFPKKGKADSLQSAKLKSAEMKKKEKVPVKIAAHKTDVHSNQGKGGNKNISKTDLPGSPSQPSSKSATQKNTQCSSSNKVQQSTNRSQVTKKTGNTTSIADALEKSTAISAEGKLKAVIGTKRKADDTSYSSSPVPPKKELKPKVDNLPPVKNSTNPKSSQTSRLTTPQKINSVPVEKVGGSVKDVNLTTMSLSSSSTKALNQRQHSETAPKSSQTPSSTSQPKQGMTKVQGVCTTSSSSSNINVKKATTTASKTFTQSKKKKDVENVSGQLACGGSIAELMGNKISENTSSNVVDDNDEYLDPSSLSKSDAKSASKTSVNEASLVKLAKPDLKPTTVAPVSQSLQNSGKEGNKLKTEGSDNIVPSTTATGAVAKKRIVRRFHRTTQTVTPHVSNKLLQCLIKIPSIDCPRKCSSDVGLQAEIVKLYQASTSVQYVSVKTDTVPQDVFNKAIHFGMLNEVGGAMTEGCWDYGIRVCNIFSSDVDKANVIIKKSDGYTISFPSKDNGALDLFFQEEEGLVQVLNHIRKNRIGSRHVCVSVIKEATIAGKNVDTEQHPRVTATVIYDQNFASSAYLSYNRAPVWNKPKADVYVSIHNVPKDVPLSIFNLMFPDVITVELDDPNIKVTKDDSCRVKLGLGRRGKSAVARNPVEQFLNLFVQVVINNKPIVLTSGLTQEEDIPEMKEILLERKRLAGEQEAEKSYPILMGVPKDINDKTKPKKHKEPEIIMQVENVESIDRVLIGRGDAWTGPATPNKLYDMKKTKAQKSRSRSSIHNMNSGELSDISDDSDFGEEMPTMVVMKEPGVTDSPDVLNRWRQTQPLNMFQRGRHHPADFPRRDPQFDNDHRNVVKDSPRPNERFVEHGRKDNPYNEQQQRAFTSRDRENSSITEREKPVDKKWPDLNDADFDQRHKVIISQKSGGGGQSVVSSEDGGDLRSMLDSLKNRRSSRTGDRMDLSPQGNRRSVEFGARSHSPSESGRTWQRELSRSPGRPDRDRRVIRKSGSPARHGRRNRSPPPVRLCQRSKERQNFRKSLSPPSRRRNRNPSPLRQRERSKERLDSRNSLSPMRRSRRSPLPSRPRQRNRGRENVKNTDPPHRKSLSPILPFRPGRKSKDGLEPTKFKQLSPCRKISSKAKDLPHKPDLRSDMDKSLMDKNSLSSSHQIEKANPISLNPDVALSKTLFNTLMGRLKEKADVYKWSNDSNSADAANVYNQINELAETLTAIKNEEEAAKSLGLSGSAVATIMEASSDVPGLSLLMRDGQQMMDVNSSSEDLLNYFKPGKPSSLTLCGQVGSGSHNQLQSTHDNTDPSKDLHPDILRYVNAGTKRPAASSPPPVIQTPVIPPPIPPPVAPPLFTSDSPTDKKMQLESIAKQIASDLRTQGLPGSLGSCVASSSSAGPSGGTWMVPPIIHPSSSSSSTVAVANQPQAQSNMMPGSAMMFGPPPSSIGPVGPPVGGPSLFSVPPPSIVPIQTMPPTSAPPIMINNNNSNNNNNMNLSANRMQHMTGMWNNPQVPNFLPQGNNNNPCRPS